MHAHQTLATYCTAALACNFKIMNNSDLTHDDYFGQGQYVFEGMVISLPFSFISNFTLNHSSFLLLLLQILCGGYFVCVSSYYRILSPICHSFDRGKCSCSEEQRQTEANSRKTTTTTKDQSKSCYRLLDSPCWCYYHYHCRILNYCQRCLLSAQKGLQEAVHKKTWSQMSMIIICMQVLV